MKKLHVKKCFIPLHLTLNQLFRDPSFIHLSQLITYYSPHYLFLGHSSVFISAHSYLPPFCRVDALVVKRQLEID